MVGLKEKLEKYIAAGLPIIYFDTYEEYKADDLIKKAACGMKIIEWNYFGGLVDFESKRSLGLGTDSIEGAINTIMDEIDNTIVIFKDISCLISEPKTIASLKNLALKIGAGQIDATIILVSNVVEIPRELEKFVTILEMDYPDSHEIEKIILDYIEGIHIDVVLLKEMSIAFKGLTEYEIQDILSLAYRSGGGFNRVDLELVFEQKRQMIMKSGILEMVPLKENICDIGGLENLKKWLNKKAKVFKNIDKAKEFGVDIPKGVLIAGVPGCGKSLNAKAAANLFQVPLLRLDMGRLMGKYVGESEANMRKAISLAEAIAPCVIWVDELEKAFAGIGGDGGGADVTTRLFGNFLTWMQEKESSAFVVATANDITKLPPELLRKGRFDEIFYVGLPSDNERKKIFEIHISKRRNMDLNDIDINKLVSRTKGYSGADIEGVVKESIENVYADEKDKLTTDDILDSIKNTHSLSEIMKEPLKKMSEEYENRKFKNASLEG